MKNLLLTIDAGNTNTVFAVFRGEKLLGSWRLATSDKRTFDEYAVWLDQFMRLKNLSLADINAAIISTVVPGVLFDFRKLCKVHINSNLMVVGDAEVESGIDILLDKPSEIGSDRIVNAIAARKKYGAPAVIIDFGTATTFDVINEKGQYIGGVIAPGINLSMQALHQAAAKLPNVAIARPQKVIAKNTVSAMQSGIYFGYLGLIEGILERIALELKKEPVVIATGGLAPLYSKGTKKIHHMDENLTIFGLKEIYELNIVERK
jgi:type III pantothenate kinase